MSVDEIRTEINESTHRDAQPVVAEKMLSECQTRWQQSAQQYDANKSFVPGARVNDDGSIDFAIRLTREQQNTLEKQLRQLLPENALSTRELPKNEVPLVGPVGEEATVGRPQQVPETPPLIGPVGERTTTGRTQQAAEDPAKPERHLDEDSEKMKAYYVPPEYRKKYEYPLSKEDIQLNEVERQNLVEDTVGFVLDKGDIGKPLFDQIANYLRAGDKESAQELIDQVNKELVDAGSELSVHLRAEGRRKAGLYGTEAFSNKIVLAEPSEHEGKPTGVTPVKSWTVNHLELTHAPHGVDNAKEYVYEYDKQPFTRSKPEPLLNRPFENPAYAPRPFFSPTNGEPHAAPSEAHPAPTHAPRRFEK